MIAELPRLARRAHPERVPRAVEGEPGLFVVDATGGVIQPISLAPGVRTVGELEVIEHLQAGRPLVDCRLPHYVERGTIPGAVNIPLAQLRDGRAGSRAPKVRSWSSTATRRAKSLPRSARPATGATPT